MWETVIDGPDKVRKFRVPGGWLYQTQLALLHEVVQNNDRVATFQMDMVPPDMLITGWSQPVFVKEP